MPMLSTNLFWSVRYAPYHSFLSAAGAIGLEVEVLTRMWLPVHCCINLASFFPSKYTRKGSLPSGFSSMINLMVCPKVANVREGSWEICLRLDKLTNFGLCLAIASASLSNQFIQMLTTVGNSGEPIGSSSF